MSFCHFGTLKSYTHPKALTDILNDLLVIDIVTCLYIELVKCYSGIAVYLNLIPDVCNAIAILLLINSKRITLFKKVSTISVILFIVWVTISFFGSISKLLVAYKRYRYILFGFFAYYICAHYMTTYYWKRILKILFFTQIIHTILVAGQFAVMGTSPDMTNGVFGYLGYNNAAHGSFCLIMSMIGIEYFLKGTMLKKHSIAMIIMSCFTCALAEIKAFYILFILGMSLILFFNKMDNRTMRRAWMLMIIGGVGLITAFLILLKVMPQNLYAFIGFQNWASYESYGNHLSGINIGRLNQMSYVFENVFDGAFFKALVGKGIGADGDFIAYEMGKIFFNFGFIGFGFFLLFLISGAVELFPYRKDIPETMISMSEYILTVPMMMMWNATLNRMALLVFVILGIGFAKCFRIDRGM